MTSQSPAREQAARTRSMSAASIKLLSRPDSPYPAPIPADRRFAADGRCLPTCGYDTSLPAPELPDDARGAAMQEISVEEICEQFVEQHVRPVQGRRSLRVTYARAVLTLLEKYPGQTWEERWIASGFDAAPRTWPENFGPTRRGESHPASRGLNALLQERVLRPSYSFLLESTRRVSIPDFLRATGGPALDEFRALPAYVGALERERVDAEAGLARIMSARGRVSSSSTATTCCTTPMS